MKKAFVFLLSVFILGCTPQKQADSTADNSRYQWDNIRKYLMEEPAYALALVDTAQTYTVLAYAQQMKTQEKELQLKDEIGRLQEENNELNEELNKTK